MNDLEVSSLRTFAFIFLGGVAASIILALIEVLIEPVENTVGGPSGIPAGIPAGSFFARAA